MKKWHLHGRHWCLLTFEGIELNVTEGVLAMRIRKLNQVMGSLSRNSLMSSVTQLLD